MAVRGLLFFTQERPSRRALREYCHGRNVKEMVVLRPSEASNGQYVCFASRNRGFFVNYDPPTVSRKMKFNHPNKILTCSGGRYATNKLLFYCFADTSRLANLTAQLYFTHGIFPAHIPETVMCNALDSQLTVSESHPTMIDRMRNALRSPMVDNAIAAVIRQGALPDMSKLSMSDSSDCEY